MVNSYYYYVYYLKPENEPSLKDKRRRTLLFDWLWNYYIHKKEVILLTLVSLIDGCTMLSVLHLCNQGYSLLRSERISGNASSLVLPLATPTLRNCFIEPWPGFPSPRGPLPRTSTTSSATCVLPPPSATAITSHTLEHFDL